MHESTKLSRPDGTLIGFEARKSWLLSTLVLPAHPSIRAKALVDFKDGVLTGRLPACWRPCA